MTTEERLDRLEARWGAQDDLVRELRDAVTVTAELERRQAKLLREHSEALVEHEQWLKEHKASMNDLDKRISDLVSGFGSICGGKFPADGYSHLLLDNEHRK